MSGGPYIETRDSPQVAGPGPLGPKNKSIPRDQHGSRVPGWDTPNDLTKPPAGVPDLATTEVPEHVATEIRAYVARYPDPRSAIIPALWVVQREHGWCSPEAITQAAAVLGFTPAEIAAVATFYDMFETEPVGTNTVYVCTNISCTLRGADDLLHAMEWKTAELRDEFHVRGFECLGACDIAPMLSINGDFVGPIQLDEVDAVIAAVRAGEEVFPERQMKNRKSTDPQAGDHANFNASGPVGEQSNVPGDDTAPVETEGADPRRQSQPYNDGGAPDGKAKTRKATGDDTQEDAK
jgi:NADH-quinone oxidoreductase subunit E